jgi:hypothetical protein
MAMPLHPPRPPRRRSAGVRRALALALALLGPPLAAAPAAAHGGVTGAQDVLQDYGVLVFLIAVVLIGAGVIAWVSLSPEPPPSRDDEQPEATSGGR